MRGLALRLVKAGAGCACGNSFVRFVEFRDRRAVHCGERRQFVEIESVEFCCGHCKDLVQFGRVDARKRSSAFARDIYARASAPFQSITPWPRGGSNRQRVRQT